MQGAQQQYEKQAQEQAKKQQVQEYRQSILTQILSSEARERLVKIKMVKPEKAVGIQNSLIQAAQSGMLKKQVSESQLVALLEKDSAEKGQSKLTFKRRGIDDQW